MTVTKYICLGCEDKCKMDSTMNITGCVYEDGDYEKDADIWVPDWTPNHLIKKKRKAIADKQEQSWTSHKKVSKILNQKQKERYSSTALTAQESGNLLENTHKR